MKVLIRQVWCLMFVLLVLPLCVSAQGKAVNPLAAYSDEWKDPKFNACNTAANTKYLSADEKELVWILNMARTEPALFAKTVVRPYSERNDIDMTSAKYYLSLMKQMRNQEPLSILQPDQQCFTSAECHATTSGKNGYTGHDRQTQRCRDVRKFNGECCSYGVEEPVGVVVTLLVDEDVPSLGHRNILLGSYARIGVAMRPHKGYRINTVLDLLR
ncbi:hypothetical protein GCM10023093_02170 [Nemorincola caseinilytica]|uniref:CAP domain-containing protein n=1 Tax=Nemorincola caseinilytica TaxID=2054315 RepID=A0ABP8N593_9BACT